MNVVPLKLYVLKLCESLFTFKSYSYRTKINYVMNSYKGVTKSAIIHYYPM